MTNSMKLFPANVWVEAKEGMMRTKKKRTERKIVITWRMGKKVSKISNYSEVKMETI